MKIPGAIIAASDCRITGSEPLYIPAHKSKTNEAEETGLDTDKLLTQNPQVNQADETVQIPIGHYDYIKTDSEQKTFLLKTMRIFRLLSVIAEMRI